MLYRYSLASFLCLEALHWFGRPVFVACAPGLELLLEASTEARPERDDAEGVVVAIATPAFLAITRSPAFTQSRRGCSATEVGSEDVSMLEERRATEGRREV
jgi:hypothetical protein